MAALIDYLSLTQKGSLPLLHAPRRQSAGQVLQLDAATRRNLELTHALSGGRANTVLSVIDRTLTAGGARLLERRLSGPSTDLAVIRARHDAVSYFVSDRLVRDEIEGRLRRIPDLDRALSRLALDRAGPRDLAAIRDGLLGASALQAAMRDQELPQVLAEARGKAAQLVEEAEGYRAQVVNEAEGQASRFSAVLEEYQKAPEVTRKRLYLETLEQVLGDIDKIIVDDSVGGGGQGIVPYLPLNELRRSSPGSDNTANRESN